ncbi:MAG: hypothetical protein JKY02_01525 [Flavobacteriaceae bacterium]|nr:hypothetical protein [Flavobacteriaceae bacterium]
MTDSIKDGASKVNESVKKNGNRAKSGFQEFLDTLGKIIIAFFNIIGKFIGVIIIITSACVLISFILAIFSVGSFGILGFDESIIHMPPFMDHSILPNWLLAITVLILVGIPFLILFVLGLRILSSNVKQFSKVTSLTLLGIWIVALLMVVFTGIEFGTSHARSGSSIVKKNLIMQPTDTLSLNIVNDDAIYYQHNLRRRDNK